MTTEYCFSKLDTDPDNPHRFGGFSMGDEIYVDLKNFIRRHARNSAKACLTQTYVACSIEDPGLVVGYVSIMCAEVELDGSYLIPEKPGSDRFKFSPAVRIARLAVVKNHRNTGLGRKLLGLAVAIIVANIRPYVGCRFVILDSLPGSIDFYKRQGFSLLDTETNRNCATPVMFLDVSRLT